MADTVNFEQLLNANYIATAWTETANANPDDYLGESLFGFKKQTALDLSWLKGSSGAPIAIAPAAYDAEIVLRGRNEAKKISTEMPLFREGIQLNESDRRALQQASALGQAAVDEIIGKVFDDTANLIKGAKVNPEIMRWQLLAPTDGKPKIAIANNDITYAYDYDPNGTWYANNFIDVSSTPWSAAATATPITNLIAAKDKAAEKGVTLEYAVMSQKTFSEFSNSAEVKSAVLAQNATATVFITPSIVKQTVKDITGLTIIIYNGIYKDFAGTTKKFMPDKVVTLIPAGLLGNTVYAVTPEEFDLRNDPTKNVATVEGGITISVVPTSELPRRFATYVSEIVLPSYERMDEVFELKVDAG